MRTFDIESLNLDYNRGKVDYDGVMICKYVDENGAEYYAPTPEDLMENFGVPAEKIAHGYFFEVKA